MPVERLVTVQSQWGTLLREAVTKEETRLKDVRIERPPHKHHEYEDLPEYAQLHAAGRRRMECFERALQHLFTRAHVRLGHLQVKLMNAIRTAMVKRMFGSKLGESEAYLMERFNIKEIFESVAIIFPRRSGKSTVQQIAAAAILVSQPDANLVCFNITGRQARSWLAEVHRYLDMFQSSDEFHFTYIQERTQEFLIVRSNATGTNNKVASYPGGQGKDFKNLRGEGGRLFMLFVDEGYWIAEEGVPVMVPLLANGAALVITSSVGAGGARTGLMAIMDAKFADGSLAVHEINYTVACEECKALGKPDQCTHHRQKPQFFQRYADQDRVEVLLSPFEGVHDRELRNKQDRPPTGLVWNLKWIKEMADDAHDRKPLGLHPIVLVGIDPHGGGGASQAAVVSAIVERVPGQREQFLIVAADLLNTQIPDELAEMLVAHIEKVRLTVPGCRDATFVINCEANMAFAAPSIDYYFETNMKGRFQFFILRDDKRTHGGSGMNTSREIVYTAGTRTTNETKMQWVLVMSKLLREHRIHFHENFTSAALLEDAPPGYHDLRAAIIRQFGEYSRTTLSPKAGKEKTQYSKTTYGGRDQDDLITATMITTWTLGRLRTSPSARHIFRHV